MTRPGPKPDPTRPRSRYRPPVRKFATETTCVNGHTFTPENTYVYSNGVNEGKKVCKVCRMNAQRKLKGLGPLERTSVGVWNRNKTECKQGHPFERFGFTKQNEGFRGCRICTRESRLRSNYGLEPEDFDRFLIACQGRCQICSSVFEAKGSIHVDHSHASGEVRGLLCTNCNNGLGRFLDSADILRRAVEYLDSYNQPVL